ncbi:MAG: ComEC/Rec2 family competence protein [Kiritimatiellae bacterium]|nr:ComEC/Rec2 family competence protein [Kiritimatiellia bacterium]
MAASAMWSKRPVIGAAVAYVLGTAGGLHYGGIWQHTLAAAALVAMTAFWASRAGVRHSLHLSARCCVLLLLAWALAARAGAELTRQFESLRAAADSRGQVRVRGEIVNGVSCRPASRGEFRYRFALRKIAIVGSDGRRALGRLTLFVTWYGPSPSGSRETTPRTGELWEFRGRLEHGRRPTLPNRHFLVTRARSSRRLSAESLSSWRGACERYRRRAAARLAAGIEARRTETALIQAMLLGYRGEIPQALNRAFRNSGTIHIFAISGMHVVVIAGILSFVVARCGVPRNFWVLPLAPLLAIYILATGSQPSALRAGIMALLYLVAPLLGRRPDTTVTLAVSALLLLAADPLQLWDLGFVLSFAVVTGLIVLAAPLSRLLNRYCGLERLALDTEAMDSLGGEAATAGALRWRRGMLRVGRYMTELAGVSLAAWLTATPLTALYFGLFTPASLLANLLVVPLSFVVMAAASVSLAAASLAPQLGMAVNLVACLCTWVMTSIAQAAADLPGGVWRIPPPPPWTLAAWYFGLACLAVRLRRAARPAKVSTSWLVREPEP